MLFSAENKKFAVLIDADNAQAKAIDHILTETARYGIVTSKRCYGDWTEPRLKNWKNILNKYAIQPIQQFAYTTGKNATDSALIIDAMDLLYTKNFDGFFLVSSDSDFTKLATRLRESGLEVIGFGEKKTPEPFRAACNKFIFTEALMSATEAAGETSEEVVKGAGKGSSKAKKAPAKNDDAAKLKQLLAEAIEACKEEDGWAQQGTVGSHMQRLDTSFDPRNFGFNQLGKLIRSLDYIEIEPRATEKGHQNYYIKMKDK